MVYDKKCIERSERERRSYMKKFAAVMVSLLFIGALTVGGTIAFLTVNTDAVENIFEVSKVSCEVQEAFDGTVKSNVTAKNTGDIDAYLRVKLISYRMNKAGERIGGVTEIPDFTLGEGWFKEGDYYYYSSPVSPGKTPESPLIGENGIALEDYHYTFYGETVTEEELAENPDAEPYGIKSGLMGGGVQVIEVMAEAIQAKGGILSGDKAGTPAVTDAWGIAVGPDGKLQPSSQTGGN